MPKVQHPPRVSYTAVLVDTAFSASSVMRLKALSAARPLLKGVTRDSHAMSRLHNDKALRVWEGLRTKLVRDSLSSPERSEDVKTMLTLVNDLSIAPLPSDRQMRVSLKGGFAAPADHQNCVAVPSPGADGHCQPGPHGGSLTAVGLTNATGRVSRSCSRRLKVVRRGEEYRGSCRPNQRHLEPKGKVALCALDL